MNELVRLDYRARGNREWDKYGLAGSTSGVGVTRCETIGY